MPTVLSEHDPGAHEWEDTICTRQRRHWYSCPWYLLANGTGANSLLTLFVLGRQAPDTTAELVVEPRGFSQSFRSLVSEIRGASDADQTAASSSMMSLSSTSHPLARVSIETGWRSSGLRTGADAIRPLHFMLDTLAD